MVDENRSLMNTIRQRQKNRLGHVLRSESLLRTVLDQRRLTRNGSASEMVPWRCAIQIHDFTFFYFTLMEETRTCGRTECYDDRLDEEQRCGIWTYGIKKRAHDREDWRHWRPVPAWKGRERERDTVDWVIFEWPISQKQQDTHVVAKDEGMSSCILHGAERVLFAIAKFLVLIIYPCYIIVLLKKYIEEIKFVL